MPRYRNIRLSEAKAYATFAGSKLDFDAIAREVEAGKTLELVESSFKDPGPDYTEIRLDGKVLVHVAGY